MRLTLRDLVGIGEHLVRQNVLDAAELRPLVDAHDELLGLQSGVRSVPSGRDPKQELQKCLHTNDVEYRRRVVDHVGAWKRWRVVASLRGEELGIGETYDPLTAEDLAALDALDRLRSVG